MTRSLVDVWVDTQFLLSETDSIACVYRGFETLTLANATSAGSLNVQQNIS
jgi:hypothetical protein